MLTQGKELEFHQSDNIVDLRQLFTLNEERKVVRKIDLVILPFVMNSLHLKSHLLSQIFLQIFN